MVHNRRRVCLAMRSLRRNWFFPLRSLACSVSLGHWFLFGVTGWFTYLVFERKKTIFYKYDAAPKCSSPFISVVYARIRMYADGLYTLVWSRLSLVECFPHFWPRFFSHFFLFSVVCWPQLVVPFFWFLHGFSPILTFDVDELNAHTHKAQQWKKSICNNKILFTSSTSLSCFGYSQKS